MRYWNIGGIRLNWEAIYQSVKCSDVIVLAETFLESSSEQNFSFPPEFLTFTAPAQRRVQDKGRGAGGVCVLVQASLFVPSQCLCLVVNEGLLHLRLTPKAGAPFHLVTGYRPENSRSPASALDFFEDLSCICHQLSEGHEHFLVVGDFNAKIGNSTSVMGQMEEFRLLVPTSSLRTELYQPGRMLLESLAGSDLIFLPFCNKQGVQEITCKANSNRASITGGSVVDLMFVSLALFDVVSGRELRLEREISSHAWLEVCLDTVSQVRFGKKPGDNIIPRLLPGDKLLSNK